MQAVIQWQYNGIKVEWSNGMKKKRSDYTVRMVTRIYIKRWCDWLVDHMNFTDIVVTSQYKW